jgi:hypothetical protein
LEAITRNFKAELTSQIEKYLAAICEEILQQKPALLFVNTKNILDYLDGPKNLNISDQLVDLIKEIICLYKIYCAFFVLDLDVPLV